MSSKTATPSRSTRSSSKPRRAAASHRRANASAVAPSHKSVVKQVAKTAIVMPLAKRALKGVKSKTGIAVLTGVALAVGAGLVRKYRPAS